MSTSSLSSPARSLSLASELLFNPLLRGEHSPSMSRAMFRNPSTSFSSARCCPRQPSTRPLFADGDIARDKGGSSSLRILFSGDYIHEVLFCPLRTFPTYDLGRFAHHLILRQTLRNFRLYNQFGCKCGTTAKHPKCSYPKHPQ
ncbi:hypothetical protein CPB86DRAFT_92588 [Serendipita vermifera]|nr:hypothetical protein CPB86DRAFT_92588 [Serendipita vermifera]